jgi:glycosyltransferase involved in cell wall biosynthesis
MRITILQGAFLPVPPLHGGAVEKLWFELGKQFSRLGHEVVHVSRTHQDLPNHGLIDGVRHFRIRGFEMPANGFLLKFYDLIYSIRALRSLPHADILVTNTFWMPILRCFTSSKTGYLVVSVERMPKGQMRFYHHVSALRCCSTSVRDRVLLEQPQLSSKTVVIPNPLPFDISEISLLPDRHPTILYCGRIHPEKGIDLLIRAFGTACQLGLIGWTLRIVGPSDVSHGGGGPDYLASLQQLSSSVDAPIEWVGPIYDEHRLQAEYLHASLFVYPSLAAHGEAMPIAPLEAMAYGVVPIVSALPCFGQYIKHGLNGLIFEHSSGDPVISLARLLVELASDPVRCCALSTEASRVSDSHAPHVIADHFIKLFNRLLVRRL